MIAPFPRGVEIPAGAEVTADRLAPMLQHPEQDVRSRALRLVGRLPAPRRTRHTR
jgi:hypothetical protein